MTEIFDDLTMGRDIGSITSGDIQITGSISGQIITLNSGGYIELPATQVVNVSGQTVVLASGFVGSVGITDDAGANMVGVGAYSNTDDNIGNLQSLLTTSFNFGYNPDSGKWSRLRVNKSGQGTLVVASSGVDHIVTGKYGTRTILFSGYGTTNTVVVSGFGFLQHERATIVLTNIGEGSGANYSVIGHAMSGVIKYVITSGVIYSGDIVRETISDPYEWIDIGVDSTQDNFSGQVTVVAVRR